MGYRSIQLRNLNEWIYAKLTGPHGRRRRPQRQRRRDPECDPIDNLRQLGNRRLSHALAYLKVYKANASASAAGLQLLPVVHKCNIPSPAGSTPSRISAS